MIEKLILLLKREWNTSKMVESDFITFNINRLIKAFYVAAPISLILIIMFSMFQKVTTPIEEQWRSSIVFAHGVLMIAMVLLRILSEFYIKNQDLKRFGKMIQYSGFILVLVAGVSITAIDLQITLAISPFLIGTMVAGVIFLIRPFHTLIIYTCMLLTFGFVVSGVLESPIDILSTMSNALMASAVGFAISLITFQTSKRSLLQKGFIESQQEQLEILNKKLTRLASHDDLTDLYSRRTFISKVEESAMKQLDDFQCISIFDIDHFKEINDEFGHPFGDYVLQKLSNLVLSLLLPGELVARWGGEEFILYMPHRSSTSGFERVEYIRKQIEKTPFLFQEITAHITVSFGVSELQCNELKYFDKAYSRADKAMYQAKSNGRNQSCVYKIDSTT
jgi:diguanylate cyclase (GGDEF)-like protein